MRLNGYLTKLTKPELEELKELLNLTQDEELIFYEYSKGNSRIATADKCGISTSCLDMKIKNIKYKMNKLGGGNYGTLNK